MKVEVLFDTTGLHRGVGPRDRARARPRRRPHALVCWLFLGSLSSTLNVVLAIPMSLLGTIAVIYFLRLHAQHLHAARPVARRRPRRRRRRHGHGEHLPPRGDGEGPRHAPPRDGTKEITFAALAATLAVIAIFLPVIFMNGRHRQVLLPVRRDALGRRRCSRTSRRSRSRRRAARRSSTTSREGRSALGRAVDRGFDALERGYARALGVALASPWIVLVAARRSCSARSRLLVHAHPARSSSRRRIRAASAVRLTTEVGADLDADRRRSSSRPRQILAKHPEVARMLTTLSGVGSAR